MKVYTTMALGMEQMDKFEPQFGEKIYRFVSY